MKNKKENNNGKRLEVIVEPIKKVGKKILLTGAIGTLWLSANLGMAKDVKSNNDPFSYLSKPEIMEWIDGLKKDIDEFRTNGDKVLDNVPRDFFESLSGYLRGLKGDKGDVLRIIDINKNGHAELPEFLSSVNYEPLFNDLENMSNLSPEEREKIKSVGKDLDAIKKFYDLKDDYDSHLESLEEYLNESLNHFKKENNTIKFTLKSSENGTIELNPNVSLLSPGTVKNLPTVYETIKSQLKNISDYLEKIKSDYEGFRDVVSEVPASKPFEKEINKPQAKEVFEKIKEYIKIVEDFIKFNYDSFDHSIKTLKDLEKRIKKGEKDIRDALAFLLANGSDLGKKNLDDILREIEKAKGLYEMFKEELQVVESFLKDVEDKYKELKGNRDDLYKEFNIVKGTLKNQKEVEKILNDHKKPFFSIGYDLTSEKYSEITDNSQKLKTMLYFPMMQGEKGVVGILVGLDSLLGNSSADSYKFDYSGMGIDAYLKFLKKIRNGEGFVLLKLGGKYEDLKGDGVYASIPLHANIDRKTLEASIFADFGIIGTGIDASYKLQSVNAKGDSSNKSELYVGFPVKLNLDDVEIGLNPYAKFLNSVLGSEVLGGVIGYVALFDNNGNGVKVGGGIEGVSSNLRSINPVFLLGVKYNDFNCDFKSKNGNATIEFGYGKDF